mgnify:CR=1 FL=1
MPVRLKRVTNLSGGDANQGWVDSTQEQRETTVDGQTFHWGPGQVRNFASDGVGLLHAAQLSNASVVRQDTMPFGNARS